MRKIITLLVIINIILSFLFFSLHKEKDFPYQLISVRWCDSTYSSALYGIYIYLGDKSNTKTEIKGIIYIGRGNSSVNYSQDLGVIGIADDAHDAVDKWGKITCSDKGIFIEGKSGIQYFLPRKKLESHR